jgi:hypothetical protein
MVFRSVSDDAHRRCVDRVTARDSIIVVFAASITMIAVMYTRFWEAGVSLNQASSPLQGSSVWTYREAWGELDKENKIRGFLGSILPGFHLAAVRYATKRSETRPSQR